MLTIKMLIKNEVLVLVFRRSSDKLARFDNKEYIRELSYKIMLIQFIDANESHITTILNFMQDFYLHERIEFNAEAARTALTHMLNNEALGRIYTITVDDQLIGYMVLTFSYSLEFHGQDAFIDEIYLKEDFRNLGIGQKAIAFLTEICQKLSIPALHLEVERDNHHAQALYRKMGFIDHDRYLMTRWLR